MLLLLSALTCNMRSLPSLLMHLQAAAPSMLGTSLHLKCVPIWSSYLSPNAEASHELTSATGRANAIQKCLYGCIEQVNPLAETRDGRLIAADAKLGFDDNAAFRQKELFALRDTSQEDPRWG